MYTKEELLKEVKGDILSDDPDDTRIAREFYSKYWPILSSNIDDYDGSIGKYRGETIISFNTIAGCMIRLLPISSVGFFSMPRKTVERLGVILASRIPGIESAREDEIKQNFIRLYEIYHSLANFMPLPMDKWIEQNQNPCNKTNIVNMNQAKGSQHRKCDCTHYYDFPDLFFKDLRRLHFDEPEGNDRAKPHFLESEINTEYIKKFKSWNEFIENNYLQDFFADREYDEFIQLAPISGKFPYTQTIADTLREDERKTCMEQIFTFLETAIKIIEKRAERL